MNSESDVGDEYVESKIGKLETKTFNLISKI